MPDTQDHGGGVDTGPSCGNNDPLRHFSRSPTFSLTLGISWGKLHPNGLTIARANGDSRMDAFDGAKQFGGRLDELAPTRTRQDGLPPVPLCVLGPGGDFRFAVCAHPVSES